MAGGTRLDEAPDGPLAAVLTTPLMLWLTRSIYEQSSSDPSELTDVRFQRQEAIEEHLLEGLVPAVYSRRNELSGQSYDPNKAQRWLVFLASHLNSASSQEFQWWQLSRAVAVARPFTVAIRAALLFAVAWPLGLWVLRRDGSGIGRLDVAHVLRGPIGPEFLPSVSFFYSYCFHAIHPLILHGPLDVIIRSESWHSFPSLNIQIALLGALAGFGLHGSEPLRPRSSKISLGAFVSGAIESLFAAAVLTVYLLMIAIGGGGPTKAPTASDAFYRYFKHFLADIYHMPHVLLLIFLVYCWIMSDSLQGTVTAAPGPVSPARGLHADRRATLLGRTLTAIFRTVLVWLVFGITAALAYSIYRMVCLLFAIFLGRLEGGSASDYFSEARIWLACTRRMPWRMMGFLSDAHQRGVLRRVGSVYQFRHLRMQECLSAGTSTRSGNSLIPLQVQRRLISAYGAFYRQSDNLSSAADDWDRAKLQLRQRTELQPPQWEMTAAETRAAEDREDGEEHYIPRGAPELLPSEQYVAVMRKHPAMIMWSFLVTLAATVVALVISVALSSHEQIIVATWTLYALLFFHLISKVARWSCCYLIFTSQRIILLSGILTHRQTIFRIPELAQLKVEMSFFGRMNGYGSANFESKAGHHLLQVDYFPYPMQILEELSRNFSWCTASDPNSATLDPYDSRPIFLQLADILHDQITTGALAPIEPVSFESQLAQEHGISRRTVKRALAELQKEGIVLGAPATGRASLAGDPKGS
jgi:hypothetical protein